MRDNTKHYESKVSCERANRCRVVERNWQSVLFIFVYLVAFVVHSAEAEHD